MTSSVVAARSGGERQANTPEPAHTRLANKGIKAIPGRKFISERLPFLSCRCAVIVDADNIRVGGHWAQPRAVRVGIRLRWRPGFRCQGFFDEFRLTPCRGDARRADVLDRARFLAARAAAASTSAAISAQPQYLRAGRTARRRAQVLRQRI